METGMKKIVLRSAVAIFLTLTLSFCLWACKGKQGPTGANGVNGSPTTIYVGSATETPTPTPFGSGSAAYADGAGNSASFNYPVGVAADSNGNVYVADANNHRVRKITSGGVVTTLAGSGLNLYNDGTGVLASFKSPLGIVVDTTGNVFVADEEDHRIRKITSGGVVSTLAGSGSAAYADGTGTAASFHYPAGIALDISGNLYVADSANNRIRKITPGGVVSTLAGSGNAAYADGTGTAASFSFPDGVAMDLSGNVYVTDSNNDRIRKITPEGEVTTFAGSGAETILDGTGTSASFFSPSGITVDGVGNFYVADKNNNRIRKITSGGVVTTLAGSGIKSYADGIGTAAAFYWPIGITVDFNKNIYVGDYMNNRVRKIQIFE
jgi:sugar lactone lactonase YvrE